MLGSLLSRSNLLLIIFGCASLVLYRLSLRAQTVNDIPWFFKLALVQGGLYLAAAWLALKTQPARSTLLLVITFAALFRLGILFSPPYLSDDIYRYVWDGRVQAAEINPYRYIPSDPALTQLRDDKIYPRIGQRDYAHTIYPPVAEAVYFLTTRISESVTWMKATMVLFEAIAIWAIAQLLISFGLPCQRILLYAWHPLIVWEFAGSGHVDAILIAFISLALLARRRDAEIATGLALASATLVKLFPFVLLPALYKRGGWKMPLVCAITIAVAYVPYLGVGPRGVLGFLPGYAAQRGMLSGEQFFILGAVRRILSGFHVPTVAFVAFAFLIVAALAVWMLRKQQHKDENYIAHSLVIASVLTVLLAPHFPWYFAWLVPFLCFIPSVPVFYLTLAAFLLYLTWIDGTDNQVFRIKALIFVPFFILAALAIWWRRRKYPGLEILSADYTDTRK
jgi:alpha-1,6-mannosyltransferase